MSGHGPSSARRASVKGRVSNQTQLRRCVGFLVCCVYRDSKPDEAMRAFFTFSTLGTNDRWDVGDGLVTRTLNSDYS